MTNPLRRILYIEDEPDIRTVAMLALQVIGGFEVVACASGAEGLAAAPGVRPDLVLLDVMMPDMDGPATLRALRAMPATAQTPIVFMTAKVQPDEVAEYKALGALDVIPKPFSPTEVSNQIRRIWERRMPVAAPGI